MYMIMRAVQILALVVFLWGKSNNNAEHLMGAGGPFLVWGSFVVMIIASYLSRKEYLKNHEVTQEQMTAGNRRSWILVVVILLAAAALTAVQFFMKE